ncbi:MULTISPECIES: hypothetical protein [unclassified Bartonella]|uniref:hypothetical protein n=2 Tax=unclassified Bartonella TaxID=2645622 RepID=UPI0035D0290C
MGVPSKNITRQIIGVAAGVAADRKSADAVNLRQLQDLEEVVRKKVENCLFLMRQLKIWVLDSAMNFSQLKGIKEQVAVSIFVKQDTATRHITISKDIDGAF